MGAYSNSIRQITQKGNTWTADQIFDCNITLNDDKILYLGSGQDVKQYFESSSSKFTLENNANKILQLSDAAGVKLDGVLIKDQQVQHAWYLTKLSDWEMYSDPATGSAIVNGDATSYAESYWNVKGNSGANPILAMKESLPAKFYYSQWKYMRFHILSKSTSGTYTLYLRRSNDGIAYYSWQQTTIGTTKEFNYLPTTFQDALQSSYYWRWAFEWAGATGSNLEIYGILLELVGA